MSITYKPLYSGHKFVQKSQAMPDQSYSVKDLLRRFTNGTAPAVAKQAFYDDNADIDHPLPDLAALDLAELQELAYTNSQNINNLKNKYNEQIRDYHERRKSEAHQPDSPDSVESPH